MRIVWCTSPMQCCYALVICNHGPTGPGNSGDFEFWSSKSLLKAPPCGDCSLVKPLLFSSAACYLFISQPFLPVLIKPPGISPALVAKLWSKTRSFPQLSPALPQAWGAVVTNDHCIRIQAMSRNLHIPLMMMDSPIIIICKA